MRAPTRLCGQLASLALILAGLLDTAAASPRPPLLTVPDAQIEPLPWDEVPGWDEDDHAEALLTLQRSCKALIRSNRGTRPAQTDERPMRRALERVCHSALRLTRPDRQAARGFFEHHFRPVEIARLGEDRGFLTGYYEPIVEGALFPSDEYRVPLYAPPSNLVAAGRRKTAEGFPNRGRIGRRLGRKKIVPYYERAEIEAGVLAGRGLEICWLKDPIDAFFLQIQGSGRVQLDTGRVLRINYAAHNGHPYTPVGRILIAQGEIPAEEMSMDRIRQWMQANPDRAEALRHANKSYVFMRPVPLDEAEEPIGAQGVPLVPGRSIAVDRRLHVYGTPFFISADLPLRSDRTVAFRRLMVAQDTGSAIIGPARADIYFGAGAEAGAVAGRLRHPGRFIMLVPRALDPVLATAGMPLPRPRPDRAILLATAADTVSTPRSIPLPKRRPGPAARKAP